MKVKRTEQQTQIFESNENDKLMMIAIVSRRNECARVPKLTHTIPKRVRAGKIPIIEFEIENGQDSNLRNDPLFASEIFMHAEWEWECLP